jgi:hypothetical protein
MNTVAATTESFRECLELLTNEVAKVVKLPGPSALETRLGPIALDVRAAMLAAIRIHGRNSPVESVWALADRIQRYAGALMDEEEDGAPSKSAISNNSTAKSESDWYRKYVEQLTATWLSLYFLGVPLAPLWDRVQLWAHGRGGGLPGGVCVSKAIGDIVRSTRKANGRRSPEVDGQPLLMHSYFPILLFPKQLIPTLETQQAQRPGNGSLVSHSMQRTGFGRPDIPHTLGLCYEYWQLRLYARAGHPIVYSVPQAVVRAILANGRRPDNLKQDEREDMLALWTEVCGDMRTLTFGGRKEAGLTARRQRVVLVEHDRPPACFVNHESGLFTFERVDGSDDGAELPLPASYMSDARRELYKDRLLAPATATQTYPEHNLLEAGSEKQLFDLMFPVAAGQESGPQPTSHPAYDAQYRQEPAK